MAVYTIFPKNQNVASQKSKTEMKDTFGSLPSRLDTVEERISDL